MKDKRKEFQRVFEFIVKHNGENISLENNKLKNFIRWAAFYKKLFIIYDNKRIAAVGIAWRTTHPENKIRDFSLDSTENGDYIYAYRVIVHPDYSWRGLMFQLMCMAATRFRGCKRIFWEKRGSTDEKPILVIKTVEQMFKELAKWQKEKPLNPHKSKQKA